MPVDKTGTYAFAAKRWVDESSIIEESSFPPIPPPPPPPDSSSSEPGGGGSEPDIKKETTVYNITATGVAIPYVPFELNVTATTYNLITGAVYNTGDTPTPTGTFGDGSSLDWEELSSTKSGNTKKSKVIVKSIDKDQTECKFAIMSKDNFEYSARVAYDVGWMRPIMPAQAKIGQAFQWKIAFKSLETIGTWDNYGATYKWQKQVVANGDWEDCSIQVSNVRWSKGVLYGSGIISANFNGKRLRLCVDYAELETRYAEAEVENVMEGVVFKEVPDALHIYGEAQTIKLFVEYTPKADDLDVVDETYYLPRFTMKAEFEGVEVDIDDYLMDEDGDEIDFSSGWTLAEGGMEWEGLVYAKPSILANGTLTLITSLAKAPEAVDVDATPVEHEADIIIATMIVGQITIHEPCIARRDFNIDVSVLGEGELAIPRYPCELKLMASIYDIDDVIIQIGDQTEAIAPDDNPPYLDFILDPTEFEYNNIGGWEATFDANVSGPCEVRLMLVDIVDDNEGFSGSGNLDEVEFEVQSIRTALAEAINERNLANHNTYYRCYYVGNTKHESNDPCTDNDGARGLARAAEVAANGYIKSEYNDLSPVLADSPYSQYNSSDDKIPILSPEETEEWYENTYDKVCGLRLIQKGWTSCRVFEKQTYDSGRVVVHHYEKEAYRPEGASETNWSMMFRDAVQKLPSPSWQDSSGDNNQDINLSLSANWSSGTDNYVDARFKAGRNRWHLNALPYMDATIIYFKHAYGNHDSFSKFGLTVPDKGEFLRFSFEQPSTGDLEWSEWSAVGTPFVSYDGWTPSANNSYHSIGAYFVCTSYTYFQFHFKHI